MTDNLYLGEEAQQKLMAGVRKVTPAVAITLGTAGKNSLIECIENPGSYPTNDGFSIINSIHLADPLEDMGRRKLCEAINRANKSSGDGSSTTCVLTAAILEEGTQHLEEASPMEIKRSLEDCIPLIEKSVLSQKKELVTDGQIDFKLLEQTATVSAEDPAIGKMIAEIYSKIGAKGIITWDTSKTSEDSYTIGTGLTVEGATYVSRYMCDIVEQGITATVKLENPLILLAKRKITSTTELDALFEGLYNQDKKEIVIFCEEMEPITINALIQARQKLGFRAVVIKMPVLFADEWWEDLALASGARIIDTVSGIRMRDVKQEHLGTVEHITVDKNDTFIDGIKDLSTQVLALQVGGTDQELNRVARLNTRTARYFVGGHSESALAYKRLKVEDAINSASCALDNGIVGGGGIALLNASESLPYKGIGSIILKEALKKPFQQIVENAGKSLDEIVLKDDGDGFDSRTGNVVNMLDAGIVDSCDVVLNAVRNAIGVAASILTIGSVVVLPREDQPQMPQSIIPR